MSISRHDTRKLAFQALFALNSNPDALPQDVYEALLEDEATTTVPAYLPELVEGVLTHQSELDAKDRSIFKLKLDACTLEQDRSLGLALSDL